VVQPFLGRRLALKGIYSFGVLAASLFFCLGCSEKPVSTEAETKQLYESPEYEKQMMGEMTGGDSSKK
jgi:hypothetical protein